LKAATSLPDMTACKRRYLWFQDDDKCTRDTTDLWETPITQTVLVSRQ